MYRRTYSAVVSDLTAEQIWKVWSDVDQWHQWQDDIESAKLQGPFARGTKFAFRPKGGPSMELELTEVEPNALFTDLTRFPLAQMLDSHELVPRDGGVEVRTTVTLRGPLSFLWRRLVVDQIVNDLPQQTERLLQRVRRG